MNHKLSKEPSEPGYYQRNQRTINYQRNQRNQRIIYQQKEPSEPGRINIKGIKQTRMDIIKGTKRTRTDHIIKGTKRTRTDIIKGTKRTLILSSKKQTNHKLIIIKGKKTRILSKEPTNHKLSKELREIIKKYDVCQLDDVSINDTNKAMILR